MSITDILIMLNFISEKLDIIQEQEPFQNDENMMNDIGEAIGYIENCIDAVDEYDANWNQNIGG